MDAEARIEAAMKVVDQYAMTDGAHHKQWVIDQIVRALTSDGYEDWVGDYNAYAEQGDYSPWDAGIAP